VSPHHLRANPEAQFLTAVLAGIAGAGIIDVGGRSPIDPMKSGLEFVNNYRLTIDNRLFDWGPQGYMHLVDLFEDEHDSLVLMAGAQTGKTARLLVKLLRSGIVHWGALFGYYFPDYHLPKAFSRERFGPFVRSNETLAPWLGRDAMKRRGSDAVLTRKYGASTFFFLSTGGKSATEGLPMKGVFFDEVRRMEKSDVSRAEERYSAQKDPIDVKVSTAFLPNQDIHMYFMRGDQRYFHSDCKCADGVVLSLTFPNCIADMAGTSSEFQRKVAHKFTVAGIPYLGMGERERAQYGDAVYVCPKCGEIIVNPRAGWWHPHNEAAYTHSYQMPQLLTPSYPAARAWQKFFRPTEVVDLQYIWNDMVGLPYIDENAQPVTMDHLMASVNPELFWPIHKGERWMRENLINCAMGVDVQQGYNVVVIKQLAENGKFRTIHTEIVHGEDPFAGTAKLMQMFNVRVCVMDAQPEYNEAFRFAKTLEGRVWLAYYVEGERTELVDWKDRPKHKAGQKGEQTRHKHTVVISRTKGLRWSLDRWTRGLNEVPPSHQLIQRLPRQGGHVILSSGLRIGQWEAVPIVQVLYFMHQTRVGFIPQEVAKGEDVKIGAREIRAEHLGGVDPHFAHAELYCNLALARIGTGPAHPRQI
jgi:hypothetical protein